MDKAILWTSGRSELFHTFSHFFTFFPPGPFLKIKPFLKRIKENQKKKTKPFCTLVVARLSSSKYRHVCTYLILRRVSPLTLRGGCGAELLKFPQSLCVI